MTELIAQRLAGLLPDPSVRDSLLQKFFDSMRFIRDRKSDWCLVHTTAGSLRLFAGRLIVFTLHEDEAWLATAPSEGSTLSALPSGAGTRSHTPSTAASRPETDTTHLPRT